MTEIQEGPHTLASRLPHKHCGVVLVLGAFAIRLHTEQNSVIRHIACTVGAVKRSSKLTDVPREMFLGGV